MMGFKTCPLLKTFQVTAKNWGASSKSKDSFLMPLKSKHTQSVVMLALKVNLCWSCKIEQGGGNNRDWG